MNFRRDETFEDTLRVEYEEPLTNTIPPIPAKLNLDELSAPGRQVDIRARIRLRYEDDGRDVIS